MATNSIVVIISIISIILFSLVIWFLVSLTNEEINDSDFPSTKILMMYPDKTNYYAFAFKTCAGNIDLSKPTILLSSDSSDKKIQLVQDIPAKRCFVTSTLIKALNSNTISLTIIPSESFFNNNLEADTITQLKDQLIQKNRDLLKLLENPKSPNFEEKFVKLTEDIRQLRKDIGIIDVILK